MGQWKLEKICESILCNACGREIVMWGWGKASKEAEEYLKEKGIEVKFFIESQQEKRDGKRVRGVSELLENEEAKANYYIVIPLDYHHEIFLELDKKGWKNETDYIYPVHAPIEIVLNGDYTDEYGNVIRCGKDIKNAGLMKLTLVGTGINIILGNHIVLEDEVHILCDNDAKIEVGDDVWIHGNDQWLVWKNAELKIGSKCRLGEGGCCEASRNGRIEIGENTRIGKSYKILAHINTKVLLGRECDISVDLIIRTNDGHSIFDVETGKNINVSLEKNKKICLCVGDHVWIGARCMLLGNVTIGKGTVIGAYSLVKGKIPNNCIAAGCTAKVIRKDIAWSRENYAVDMNIISEEYINYTQQEETYVLRK